MQILVLTVVLAAAAALWLVTLGPWRAVAVEGPALPARPPIEGALDRESVLAALAQHVYGPEPAPIAPQVTRMSIPPERAGGVPGVEQWTIDPGPAGRFTLVLVLPADVARPATIVMQNFCGCRAAFPGRPEAISGPLQWAPWLCGAGFDPLMRAMFGAHINAPPFELIAARGYALALVYAGDIVPDRTPDARRALAAFAPRDAGAVSAWAWVHSRALDALLEDERLDPARFIVWGQSRNGKAALLAGARDQRFAAVAALQSGRGGDALTQHRAGESVRAINMQFPHWFTPRFGAYARADPPVDQHQLLALIAPRPLLIGHARRDRWADPAGAYAAVKAAAPAFDALGAPPPSFFLRDGVHGIVREDWERTLDFLDARLR